MAKQHSELYEGLLRGMARFGANREGAAEEAFGFDGALIRKNVVLAPWWEPTVFDPALFGTGEYISPVPGAETMVWDMTAPNGEKFSYIKTHIGAPVCTDIALALGLTACERCIFIGSVGALDVNMQIGDIVVPKVSVCGDGVSRYLLPGSLKENDAFGREAYPDRELNAMLLANAQRIAREETVRFHTSRNFSIDTIFAQFARIDEILALGCNSVEMETAAAFLAAELSGYKMAALFSVSDNTLINKSLMGGREDEERRYRKHVRRQVFPKIIHSCFA